VIVHCWNPAVDDVASSAVRTQPAYVRIPLEMASGAHLWCPLKLSTIVAFPTGHLKMLTLK
jgi:hypothetical protein